MTMICVCVSSDCWCDFCLLDPEEFLIVIMHHILALDPLLKLYAYNTAAN